MTTSDHRTVWQKAADVLAGPLLELQATRNLPPCTWTITVDGTLTVICPGLPLSRRPGDFNRWVAALGHPSLRQDNRSSAGPRRLRAVWDNWRGTRLTLLAEIYEETGGETGPEQPRSR